MDNIVPLYYELKKAKGAQLSNEAFFDGMAKAFTTGNIGPISNNITKIWNNDKITQQEIDVVKWLCFENNAVINSIVTLHSNVYVKSGEPTNVGCADNRC